MADDEQFSLCWNNFNSNLSAGFHESLLNGDLVDVTLAAEGQLVKAHRLVLSVCSPYFRKMFTQMPANQHAFVFLKDVSHTALKDLIQFMYCGEVNVKQEALPAFISTAEALQIKGLTDSDPPPQSPAKPSTPAPQPPVQQINTPQQRVRQRTSGSRYKIETIEDSGDDSKQTQIVIQPAQPQTTQTVVQPQLHQQTQHSVQAVAAAAVSAAPVVSQKRPAQRNIGIAMHTAKRTKSTMDPLEAAESSANQQQISIQTVLAESKQMQSRQNETTEFIDLPIEMPTKSEPDYTEEAGDVEASEQEGAYVEDDNYGEMRYEESYYEENEDAGNATAASVSSNLSGAGATTSKAIVKQQQFSDTSYTTDPNNDTNNEAQGDDQAKSSADSITTRGRKPAAKKPKTTIVERIKAAIKKSNGEPPVYTSTTKGGMKIMFEGHHFKYSFRTGQYSIFQCCYKENGEQCEVRVVYDQKRVYHLEGEHVHFMQAMDKSVTSIMEVPFSQKQQQPQQKETVEQVDVAQVIDVVTIEPDNALQPELDPNDFREKIKKRLQKALLGKKK